MIVSIVTTLIVSLLALGSVLILVGEISRVTAPVRPPRFVKAWWSWIDSPEYHGVSWISQFIGFTIGGIQRFNRVFTVLNGLLILVAIFAVFNLVKFMYIINGSEVEFKNISDSLSSFASSYRSFLWKGLLAYFSGALLFGVGAAILQAASKATKAIGVIISIIAGLVLFGATVYMVIQGAILIITYVYPIYGNILSTSVSGNLFQAVASQFLIWGLNALAIGLPASLVALLIAISFRRILAVGLLNREEREAFKGNQAQLVAKLSGRIGLSSGITASYLVTSILLAIGATSIAPDVEAPAQLYLSNFIFDGATLLTTIMMLAFLATRKHKSIWLIPVMGLDLAIASLYAVGSLTLGLARSEASPSFTESFTLLMWFEPWSKAHEFIEYFYVMHSAFFPTFFLWGSLLLVLTGKGVAFAFGNALRGGNVDRRPEDVPDRLALRQTGTHLIAIATALGFLTGVYHAPQFMSALG